MLCTSIYACIYRSMDDTRFENHKANIGGFGNSNKAMTSGVVSKPIPPAILDRFRAMVKEREAEVRVSEEDVSLSTDDVVRLYEMVLAELSFNSKPIITDLTIIAGEQREHGEGIADAICARILEVPVELKLPSLYLLDSVVKNIGREYATYFSARLPKVFCEAYMQVHPNMHTAMRHLFATWSTVFPSSVLRKIVARLQLSPHLDNQSSSLPSFRASESPRPSHGIHVNPKYLEAGHQFGHTTADANIPPARGSTSTSKIYGSKPSIGYGEYSSDNAEVNPTQVGAERLGSSVHGGHAAADVEAIKLHPPSVARIARSTSPFGAKRGRSLSPSRDDFPVDGSSRRGVEKASSSHSGFEYGLARVSGRHEQVNDWQRNILPDDVGRQFETSTAYKYNNGIDLDRPRALIDAYGMDEREKPSNHKLLKIDQLNANGIHKNSSLKTWQNTEEEEFNWEDMSPTLVDSCRSNDPFSPSVQLPAKFRTIPGFRTHPAAPVVTTDFRSNWNNQAQLTATYQSWDISSITSGRGTIDRISGLRNEKTQLPGSHYAREGFNLSQSLAQPSYNHFSIKGGGKNLHMPFSSPSSAEQKPPLIGSFQNADGQFRGHSTAASRISSSGFESLAPEILPDAAAPNSTGKWPPPNIHSSYYPPSLPSPRTHEKIGYHPDAVVHQGPNRSSFPGQQSDTVKSKSQNLPQFLNQHHGLIPVNPQFRAQMNLLQRHPRLSQEVHQNIVSPASVVAPTHLVRPFLNHGYIPQELGAPVGSVLVSTIQSVHSSIPISNASLHSPGEALQPIPRGPNPVSSQMLPLSQNPGPAGPNPPAGGALSGLFNTLMAQGLISLTKQSPMQDSVGLDFDQDVLKVRHESAITALYADLPRQCTTCGLRFKCQEAHSSHMDWHVTKNRISKNRKQKPSRKWLVSVSMWLSSAEASGTDAVPGFLPSENAVEKKDDEEMAVPADDDQKVCALCGDPFDDFYSDETEEWMYKGAVYMNAPGGSTAAMDRSQLGPIVHAKCRSETSGVSAEEFQKNEAG